MDDQAGNKNKNKQCMSLEALDLPHWEFKNKFM